ncbi:hypothetical protein [Sporolactobacillus pectinivorans]|uniref:anti-sigma-I factor RsgI family protein n=1 Tax=Sporolactobacillus pectinivorans TaxID=1591408 RepID=UPI0013903223|nr:hypothetical protein [Sporolactobacillus pectinivorans]
MSEHLSQSHPFRKYLLVPVLTLGFSMLCFAPVTHNVSAPSRSAAAYVNIGLASGIEASVDRYFHIISVRPLSRAAKKVIPDPSALENLSFRNFSSALISRLYSHGDLKGGSLCLISTTFTNQVRGSQREAFNTELLRAFMDGTSEMVRGSGPASQWVQTAMANQDAVKGNGQSARKYMLYLQAKTRGSVLTLDKVRKLSTAGIEKAVPPITIPWKKLVKKITDGQDRASFIEKGPDQIQTANTLFQNPFRDVGQSGRNSSSYLFHENHFVAVPLSAGQREA